MRASARFFRLFGAHSGVCTGPRSDGLVGYKGCSYNEGEVSIILEFMDLGGLDRVLKRAGRMPEEVCCVLCCVV